MEVCQINYFPQELLSLLSQCLKAFENQLKKLLHIIDKLPKADREKAVDILKISATHYSNLTVSQSLQEVATLAAVSQPYLTGETLEIKLAVVVIFALIVRVGT